MTDKKHSLPQNLLLSPKVVAEGVEAIRRTGEEKRRLAEERGDPTIWFDEEAAREAVTQLYDSHTIATGALVRKLELERAEVDALTTALRKARGAIAPVAILCSVLGTCAGIILIHVYQWAFFS